MSFVCIKNLSFSLEFKFIKLSFNSKAFSNKDCLKSEYSSHSNRKCVSLSMEFVLQNLHSLSFNGVFGLVYRPVSIAIGRLHERNLKRMRQWSLDKGKEQYHSAFKVFLYVLYVLNFSDSFNCLFHFS